MPQIRTVFHSTFTYLYGVTKLKRFKCTWDERVGQHDGFGDEVNHHFESRSVIIEAENEDQACDQWEKEYANKGTNGLDDCVEVIEHALFAKHLFVDMPDGITYCISVELIARHRAEYYAHKNYNGDIAESLRHDTLPLFESDDFEIRDWASNNMNWSDVKKHATMLTKKISNELYEDAWCNGEWKIS